ncbi:Ubiquinone biosynthesis protein [Physocladia obscura]|uniref:4-hydroxy-3-methoxy-5-polyprenylbenzoate decarboxylase n=1 Tax=Physocladia obscura TaxID=109957 RepID=A0AAD5T4J2_9FUNG|nr:Ubiquinone biosynthesis protein [Physocladia obscura]
MFAQLPMAIRAGFKALSNPSREDMVAALGELTGQFAVQSMRRRMVLDATGRRILRDRPLINTSTVSLDKLRSLPKNTLGRAYVNFLDNECVSPDTRTPVNHMPEADEELKYVMLRYRQVHDFFHVLTGLGTKLEEEIAVKWFELAQTGLPVALLSGVLGPLRLNSQDRKLLFSEHVPWLVQCGANSKFLMNLYYEEIFEENINDVRKNCGVFLPHGFIPQDALIKD